MKKHLYEGGLKRLKTFFSENFFIIFQHTHLVTLHTSPSDARISATRPNSTRRFSLQNNYSRR